MRVKVLANATIYTGKEKLTGKTLFIKEDKIHSVTGGESIPSGSEVIDCRGLAISSGFIDLQIAGAGGLLFSSHTDAASLEKITESIVRSGTTGFLIVLPTNLPEVYRKAIKTVRENPHPSLLGLHLEGPYISYARRGAHVPEYIKKPGLKELSALLREGEGIIRMMTVAPEVCSPEFISMLNDHGVVVCAGHSNATFSEAEKGFRMGIASTTHLFNAMSSFHHREPGLPGATFLDKNAMSSIVADGIHVSFSAITVAKRIMQERLFLISDAVEENSSGAYRHVKQSDRYTLSDGTLSGSALTMMKAVKNCIEKAGISDEETIRMASLYPSRLMGLKGVGYISPGATANLVLFDKNFDVRSVFLDGVQI